MPANDMYNVHEVYALVNCTDFHYLFVGTQYTYVCRDIYYGRIFYINLKWSLFLGFDFGVWMQVVRFVLMSKSMDVV